MEICEANGLMLRFQLSVENVSLQWKEDPVIGWLRLFCTDRGGRNQAGGAVAFCSLCPLVSGLEQIELL